MASPSLDSRPVAGREVVPEPRPHLTWDGEGRVNHIKMIKRQMSGRAGLTLLRKRVLLTAAGR